MSNPSTNQPTLDQYAQNTKMLFDAIKSGCIEDVERLIPVSDPQSDESLCLWVAADIGRIDIVKLLMPVSDPKARENSALRIAALNQNVELVKYLLPFSDGEAALMKMGGDAQWAKAVVLLQKCIDEHESLQQQERLNNAVTSLSIECSSVAKRKM